MPVPTQLNQVYTLFPTLTREQIDAARTSAWYDTFADITFPAKFIDLKELGEEEEFLRWLEADSIFLPEGSEGIQPPPISTASESPPMPRSRSNSDASDSSSSSSVAPVYHLPKLNAAVRQAIEQYDGAVFPKLNWTSPKDAAFILPQASSGPLYCSSPADMYLLLKSSDFISHDLDHERAYSGVQGPQVEEMPKIELVFKKFESLNPSREVRCFVRNNVLVGITQRDMNFYDHLQPEEVRSKISRTVREFWEDEIRENYEGGDDYVFDLYLSPNFDSATIIDFQPYRESTDSLLFTYEELLAILQASMSLSDSELRPRLPLFKIIDSQAHPAVTRNAPTYQSNMMPLEMIEFSEGRNMAEFKEAWDEAVRMGMTE
ncbi:cytoplasmic protein [Cryptococcus neoformans Bt120]|nr:cytoplasmic protein [Cryptococcus neoformans var. grubii Bt15]OXG33261.1 cytoplasmic protein [Cryptococcus neoformans var. grubii Bt120]